MLLVFHSEPVSDVLMLAEHALPVLLATGRDYVDGLPERGAFSAEQLPAAIAGIEHAMAYAESTETVSAAEDQEAYDRPHVHVMEQPVNFHQRAYPLLDMMRLAQSKGQSVMWEPASNW